MSHVSGIFAPFTLAVCSTQTLHVFPLACDFRCLLVSLRRTQVFVCSCSSTHCRATSSAWTCACLAVAKAR